MSRKDYEDLLSEIADECEARVSALQLDKESREIT